MLKKIIDNFIKSHGRRPRVLICNFEPTEKSVEYSDLAIQYANNGFDVDLAPCNSELSHIFKQSIENDVHFIHLHLNSYENKKIISELDFRKTWEDFEVVVVIVLINIHKILGIYSYRINQNVFILMIQCSRMRVMWKITGMRNTNWFYIDIKNSRLFWGYNNIKISLNVRF